MKLVDQRGVEGIADLGTLQFHRGDRALAAHREQTWLHAAAFAPHCRLPYHDVPPTVLA